MITLRIYTTYDILSKQVGLSLNETNLEYWRTRSEFKNFFTRQDSGLLFLERKIDESELYENLKNIAKYNLTYELSRE